MIVGIDKALPWLFGKPAQNVVVLCIQLDVVLVEIFKELIGSKHLCNFDQLVRVTLSVEKGFLSEDHRGKHGT